MGLDGLSFFLLLYVVLFAFRFWRPNPWILLIAGAVFLFSQGHSGIAIPLYLAFVAYGGAFLLVRTNRNPWVCGILLALLFLPLLFFKSAAAPAWIFPIGISFLTFHCVSYLVDVHRGFAAPEGSASQLLLYVTYFPQLVAGPITRSREILPQLKAPARPDAVATRRALWTIYLGLFKKYAIANVLVVVVGAVFASPEAFRPLIVLVAVLAGRYYIFSDFSAYTDIAMGSSRLLGIELPQNFERPFASRSVPEFWRRWHVTLSAWIRDYVFVPLAAGPLGRFGIYPAILLSFAFLGAWHGFTLNFLLFGLSQGALVILHEATRKWRPQLWSKLGLNSRAAESWIFPWLNYLLLLTPTTIFFLAPDPARAWGIARALSGHGGPHAWKISTFEAALCAVSMVALEIFQWHSARGDCFARFEAMGRPARWAVYLVAFAWMAVAYATTESRGFLYSHF